MPGILQHSPQRIVGAFFAEQEFGSDPSSQPGNPWPIFNGREPDRPDNLIKVSGTAGVNKGSIQIDGEQEDWNGIQVLVRSFSETIAWQKILQLALALDGLRNYQIYLPLPDDGTVDTGTGTGTGTGPLDPGPGVAHYSIEAVNRTTTPVFIGRDVPEGKRVLYTVNAVCVIRQCCPVV